MALITVDEDEYEALKLKARGKPCQMMGWEDVVAALGVSRSSAYQIIRQLNRELEKMDYLTVRGKVSRAYFEERTYGVDIG